MSLIVGYTVLGLVAVAVLTPRAVPITGEIIYRIASDKLALNIRHPTSGSRARCRSLSGMGIFGLRCVVITYSVNSVESTTVSATYNCQWWCQNSTGGSKGPLYQVLRSMLSIVVTVPVDTQAGTGSIQISTWITVIKVL
jgi:hypothetical protein